MLFATTTPLPWSEAARTISRPYGDVVEQYFEDDRVRALLAWMAAQSGAPPSGPLSAPFVLWHPLYHESGVARPRGGSGMLTQALRRHVVSHGGAVRTDAPVDDILAPEGGKVLWLWGQYFPYELVGDRTWNDIGKRVADRLLDAFEQYAPGTREKVVGCLFQDPA